MKEEKMTHPPFKLALYCGTVAVIEPSHVSPPPEAYKNLPPPLIHIGTLLPDKGRADRESDKRTNAWISGSLRTLYKPCHKINVDILNHGLCYFWRAHIYDKLFQSVSWHFGQTPPSPVSRYLNDQGRIFYHYPLPPPGVIHISADARNAHFSNPPPT